MNESVRLRRIIRFGVYELDLASEELRKGGLKFWLRGQPFQILAILVERPGQIVTREELQKKLWPDGTFVDFDHSLNTAMNKKREAVGDSAENPNLRHCWNKRPARLTLVHVPPVKHRRRWTVLTREPGTVGRALGPWMQEIRLLLQ